MGGFNWKDIYCEMPIHIRRFYLKQLDEIAKEKNNSKNKPDPKTMVHRPNISPGNIPKSPIIQPKRKK